jgi:hypothetical protein
VQLVGKQIYKLYVVWYIIVKKISIVEDKICFSALEQLWLKNNKEILPPQKVVTVSTGSPPVGRMRPVRCRPGQTFRAKVKI